MQRRHAGLAGGAEQGMLGNVFGQQQLDPVNQFRGRWLLLEAGHIAHFIKSLQRLRQQIPFQVREVHFDNLFHGVFVGEPDVMKEAAAQEGVRQFLFIIGGNDDQRPMYRAHHFARFIDIKFHAVEFAQQVVGELDIGLVDFIDQQDLRLVGSKCLPQDTLDDVVVDILDPFIAQLRITQTRYGVVFVQSLLRLGCGFDMPLQQWPLQSRPHFFGQHGFAGARFTLDEQRALQRQGSIDRKFEIVGRNITGGTFKSCFLSHGGLVSG